MGDERRVGARTPWWAGGQRALFLFLCLSLFMSFFLNPELCEATTRAPWWRPHGPDEGATFGLRRLPIADLMIPPPFWRRPPCAYSSALPPARAARPRYEAESPDEGALVEAARGLGWSFVGRAGESLSVEGAGDYRILAVNAFTSARKRMSAVVRAPSGEVRARP